MEITSSEYSEWMEYMQEEPPADKKRSYEAALICLTIVKAFTGDKNAKLEDFLLKYNEARRSNTAPISLTALKAKLWAWAGAMKRKAGR